MTGISSRGRRSGRPGDSKLRELLSGLTILKREPKVLVGGLVRIINTTSQFAFVVFMPLYLKDYGIGDTQWASIWGSVFLFNILFNLVFGIVGDHFGWGRTVAWFGGVGCALGVLLFFYAPMICNNYWFILGCGALWCIMLAGYVPLSALVPSLVDKDKGAAVSVLNLGAGLSAFVGPLLVALFRHSIGYAGIVWVMAGLYLLSAVMTCWDRISQAIAATGCSEWKPDCRRMGQSGLLCSCRRWQKWLQNGYPTPKLSAVLRHLKLWIHRLPAGLLGLWSWMPQSRRSTANLMSSRMPRPVLKPSCL